MNKFLIPAFASLLLATGTVHAKTLTGKVVSIADGDTLTVLVAGNKQERIRLAEIDAPESKQPFGQRSKQSLTRMCGGKTAVVTVSSTDRYGRNIGRVVCDGVDTSKEQVRLGMAWVYTGYSKDRSLPPLQAQARASKTGLWADPHALEPWLWRKGERPGGATVSASASTKSAASAQGAVRGNRNSMIYHLPHCGSYDSINPKNVQPFSSESAAKAAGYRKAGNCK